MVFGYGTETCLRREGGLRLLKEWWWLVADLRVWTLCDCAFSVEFLSIFKYIL